jgi:fatty-acid desaturase
MNKWNKGINWPILLGVLSFHIGAIMAPFYFTWVSFFLFLSLYALTSIGVTLGYHRLITHDGFKTYKSIYYFLAILGQLSVEGSAIWWTANHRKHHQFSDKEGDPHSPLDGFLWSHMLWFLPNNEENKTIYKYAPDLIKDPFLLFLHDKTFHIIILSILTLFGLGYLWDLNTAISFVLWGFFFRVCFVSHTTWLVNSASHKWGYINYPSNDNSKNLWWVALLTFGEGWHGNHHAFPRCAQHGHKWWEIDITYWIISIMEKIGLAWDIIKK